MMENLISNISVEWKAVLVTIAFVATGGCTYMMIRIVAKLILAMIGPIDDDTFDGDLK